MYKETKLEATQTQGREGENSTQKKELNKKIKDSKGKHCNI